MKMKIQVLLFLLLTFLGASGQSGFLDHSFGNVGYILNSQDSFNRGGEGIVLQSDGKILSIGCSSLLQVPSVGGYYGVLGVVRYNSNGTLDFSYGNNGFVKVLRGIKTYISILRAVLQDDGKLLIGAVILNTDSNFDFVLMRLDSNGKIDSTFGNSGMVQTDFAGQNDFPTGLALQPDGKIIQSGHSDRGTGNNSQVTMIRLNPDGSVDSTFGINGKIDSAISHVLGYCWINDLLLLPNSKALVTGKIGSSGYLACFNPNGSIDSTYGDYGIAHLTAQNFIPHSLAKQSNGAVILVGDSESLPNAVYSCVMRFTSSGQIDTSFNHQGYSVEKSVRYSIGVSTVVQADDKILSLVYYSHDINSNGKVANVVYRYLTNGELDSSFAIDGSFKLDTGLVKKQDCFAMVQQVDSKILVSGAGSMSSDSLQSTMIFRLTNSLNLGILDLKIGSDFLIYPNPISESATLLYRLESDEILSIAMYDLLGSEVQVFCKSERQTYGDHERTILLKHGLSPGNYILRISGKTVSKSIKIVIR